MLTITSSPTRVPLICISILTRASDLESGPFVEALVQLRHQLSRDPDSSFFNIHVSFVPLFVTLYLPIPTRMAFPDLPNIQGSTERRRPSLPSMRSGRCAAPA